MLSKLVTWMRGQPGTSDLRALAYMDEVFGFVPPTAMPPAKQPILTLLKQARAFGVGMVLATQNPVDLDYKAMSNAGTWLVGRLQTERDKARVLEGLRRRRAPPTSQALDTAIGGLEKRQFLLVSAQEPPPGALHDALGDVVPARPADEGADRDADAGRAAAGARGGDSARGDPAPPSSRRRTSAGRADRRARCPGSLSRSRPPPWAAQVGAEPRATALEPSSPPGSTFASTTRGPASTRARSGRPSTARWTAVPTSGSETASTTTTATSRPDPPAGRAYVLPQAPLDEAGFFRDATAQIRLASSSAARSRFSATLR